MRANTLAALAWLLVAAHPATATDLAKIDATLIKEPAYQTATPRYGLLVFGPKATARVWVVIDGDVVYVDRNGNGDLTEPGEKFALSKALPLNSPLYQAERSTPAVTVGDGKLKHTVTITQWVPRADPAPKTEVGRQLQVLVKKDPRGFVYGVRATVAVKELPGGKIAFSGRIEQTAGVDAQGFLQFGPRGKEAPILHFGGRLEMGLLERQTLPQGDQPGDLVAVVGTRGHGPGTFAAVDYNGLIGDGVHPVAELALPNADAGKAPVSLRVVLKHRC